MLAVHQIHCVDASNLKVSDPFSTLDSKVIENKISFINVHPRRDECMDAYKTKVLSLGYPEAAFSVVERIEVDRYNSGE